MKKYSISLILISVLSLNSSQLSAQENTGFIKKLIKKFVSSEKDSSRSGSFVVLPAVGYAQETGFEYGIASTYNFYIDKENLVSRTSNVTLIGTLTTKKQKNIKLTSDIWTKNNDYHIISELRFRDWPFNFYGLGNDTWKADEDYLDQKLYRIKLDGEKRFAPNFYAGINLNYENFQFNDIESGGIFESPEVLGKDGGQYMALGVSALYDTRNNTTYTTNGFYGRAKYSYAPNFFGKDNFVGNQIEFDIRGFYPITKQLTVAAQGLFRGTYGKNVPFYVMRELGGDMTMRGYYLGRYKDKNYMTAQAELRYRFHPRIGINGFLGTGSTFSKQHDMRLIPSYGAGLRYFFSLEHNSSIRFDYAFGEQRPGEKRQSGFYLSISEAF
ncbi:outer membrane protein assembly factor [Sphingobacterium daejeonense]|uniref:outer membrane protein assembly factor n=1 Tax=Sphingobacterium daejeonense TaxID=371142 RepID=UPI0021A8F902|nr:outer membrane protein assembly factor [Sphingobacterium daejeonense]MCT1529450.1 outer membrane protein assembly factor [Sphingobacterium daejeonense]